MYRLFIKKVWYVEDIKSFLRLHHSISVCTAAFRGFPSVSECLRRISRSDRQMVGRSLAELTTKFRKITTF